MCVWVCGLVGGHRFPGRAKKEEGEGEDSLAKVWVFAWEDAGMRMDNAHRRTT